MAEAVIARAKTRSVGEIEGEVVIDYTNHQGRISVVEPLRGRHGALRVDCLTVETLGQAEDHLILSAVTSDGDFTPVEPEVAARLLTISARIDSPPRQSSLDTSVVRQEIGAKLVALAGTREHTVRRTISERSAKALETEADKLDGWADDLKISLEREIKELDRQIKEGRRAASLALTLEEKLEAQRRMKAIEFSRSEKRRALFSSQDEIDRKRGGLIAAMEAQLAQKVTREWLFTLTWRVV